MPRRPLITEREVRRAASDGTKRLDATGAIVTPSALDAAGQLGVALEGLARSGKRPAAQVRLRDRAEKKGRGKREEGSEPGIRGNAPPSADLAARSPARPSADPPASARHNRRVVLGADHGGVALKDVLLLFLRGHGHDVEDVGTNGSEAVDYPDFAVAVARAVASGRADIGIMIDGAGIGSCMVANKVAGIRAAMCYDVTTAGNAREHNNANVLTLGGTLIGPRLAQEIVTTFLGVAFAGGRHAGRVAKLDALDAPAVGNRRTQP